MKLVKLFDFEKQVAENTATDFKKEQNRILYTDNSGVRCLLDNVEISLVEDNLLIKEGESAITIKDPFVEQRILEIEENRQQSLAFKEKRNKVILRAVLWMIILLLASSALERAVRPGIKIQDKLESLVEIQKSLQDLDVYVSNQKIEVEEVAKTLNALKSEKNQTEEILKLTAPQVVAIQESLGRQKKRDRWMDIGTGILGGIVSSILFQMLYNVWRGKESGARQ